MRLWGQPFQKKQRLHPPLARVWCLGHEGPAQGGVGLAAEGQWSQQGLTGGDQKGAEVVLEDLEGALCLGAGHTGAACGKHPHILLCPLSL